MTLAWWKTIGMLGDVEMGVSTHALKGIHIKIVLPILLFCSQNYNVEVLYEISNLKCW